MHKLFNTNLQNFRFQHSNLTKTTSSPSQIKF